MTQNDPLQYQHDVYAPYAPPQNEQWQPIAPTVKEDEIAVLMEQIVDTGALESEHAILKVFVEFGVVDYMLEGTSGAIRDKLTAMQTEYVRVTEQLKASHERNHNIMVSVGHGLKGDITGAVASHQGVSHNVGGQTAYHDPSSHGPTYGQQGMPYQNYHSYQQQNPVANLGKGLVNKFTGFQVFGQPGAAQPPPQYPPPYPPQYPPGQYPPYPPR